MPSTLRIPVNGQANYIKLLCFLNKIDSLLPYNLHKEYIPFAKLLIPRSCQDGRVVCFPLWSGEYWDSWRDTQHSPLYPR